MDLLLFGIQGSGKGTQAKMLAAEFSYDIFEAGGELRKIIASGSETGKIVASHINGGNHAPTPIIIAAVSEAVAAKPQETKILFDGIPRNLEQMEPFNEMMRKAGRTFRCIHLIIPHDEALKRLTHRAQLEGRADDANMESINTRLSLFHEKTLPVIHKYAAEGNMIEVDGMASVDEVYRRMKEVVAAF